MGHASRRPTKSEAQLWQRAECRQGRSCVPMRSSMQTTQMRSRRGGGCSVEPASWRAAATSRCSTTATAVGRPRASAALLSPQSTLTISVAMPADMVRALRLQHGSGRLAATRFAAASAGSWPGGSCSSNCIQRGCARGLRVPVAACCASPARMSRGSGRSWRSDRAPGSASCAAERPKSTSSSTTPREKMSEAREKRPVKRCSGSVYGGVPTTAPCDVSLPLSSDLQTQPQFPSRAMMPPPNAGNKNTASLLMSRWTKRRS
mmetsp:Transcript_35050/g.111336  ORF Transcript_35050/g.111336 Transcript_35050/m.111336 type:complete len:262 (-) Transcript_35050:345-1130(-)